MLGKDPKTGRIVVAVNETGRKLIKKANLSLVLIPQALPLMIPDGDSNASVNMAWAPGAETYDLEAGLDASLHHAAESAAQHDAPLMDTLMRCSQKTDVFKIVQGEFSRNDEWFRGALMTSGSGGSLWGQVLCCPGFA